MWKYTDETNTSVTDGVLVIEVGSVDWFSNGLDIKAAGGEIYPYDYVAPTPPEEPAPEEPSNPKPPTDFNLVVAWTDKTKSAVRVIDGPSHLTPYDEEWKSLNILGYLQKGLVKDWDFDVVEPEPIPPTLDEAKAKVVAAINQWRDNEENKSPNIVEVNGIEWDVDPRARERISKSILSTTKPPAWTDANNIDRTDYDLQAILDAVVAQGFAIHQRQRQMKTELQSLNTVEQVEAYKIGW
ncbi:DUF4376 domain-containing protein [Vibrio mediterranei]